MASGAKFVRNLICPDKVAPAVWLGKFGAPGTAVAVGDILEFTGNTNSEFVPLDSDYDMSANGGDLAIAACDVKSGDRAGYYPVWLIAEGDVWEVDLAAAGASAYATSLYYSAKNTLTTSAGTHIVGVVSDIRNVPEQGHLSVDGSPDAGTTFRTISRVGVSFQRSNSYISRILTA
jgi:hypothetical protein